MANKKCAIKYCRGKRLSGRTICAKCKSRRVRALDPVKAAYWRKRWNAKVKGYAFTLTFEQYKAVWKPGYQIDRIDPTRGYHADNIQALTPKENRFKQREDLRTVRARMDNDCPF